MSSNSSNLLSPKGFVIKKNGKAFLNYIKEGFSYNEKKKRWIKGGQPYIHQVINPQTKSLIPVDGEVFSMLTNSNYIYDQKTNLLKKVVLLPEDNRKIIIGSREFDKIAFKTHAYDSKNNSLIKYKSKISDGYVFNPKSGKSIIIGGELYENLRKEGFVLNANTNKMVRKITNENIVINPKTMNNIKINGDKFNELIAEGYKYIESTNSLEKYDYCRIKIIKDFGHFNKLLSQTKFEPVNDEELDFYKYAQKIKPKIINEYQKQFKVRGPIKIGLITSFKYEEKSSDPTYKWSSSIDTAPTILNLESIPTVVDKMFEQMGSSIQEFHHTDTGGQLTGIGETSACTYNYSPLAAGSYIKTPDSIENKKAVINVRNSDNKCIIWSILACLHPQDKHANRVSKYEKYEKDIKVEGIKFPITLKDIDKLEKMNNIRINIVDFGKNLVPFYVSDKKCGTEVNLLRIIQGNKAHYCWIKNPSRLLAKVKTHEHKTFWCFRCLTGFSSEKHREKHGQKNKCTEREKKMKVEMPVGGSVYFKNYNKQLEVPFIFYCDAESYLIKTDEKKGTNSNIYERHQANSFGCYFLSKVDKFKSKYLTFEGDDCTEKFLKYLIKQQAVLISYLKSTNKEMTLTKQQETEYRKATHCHICSKKFEKTDGENKKVRDHDHLTGYYRGPAHNECNLKYSYKNIYIPVVFHNLKGYDSHLIMQAAGKVIEEINRKKIEQKLEKFRNMSEEEKKEKQKRPNLLTINVIANSSEKYLSFNIGKLRFIDSLNFISTSLDEMVKNFKNSKGKFKHLNSQFKGITENKLELITQKGIYPYEYIDCHEKLMETELPAISHFTSMLSVSSLNGKLKPPRLTKKDFDNYEHAQTVYKEFECKTIKDYHDLYLKTDVILLADCFESFRKTCFRNYKLDPAHYLTAPGLSFDAMLKKTNITIELFEQEDMLEFVESGMKGGISVISSRYGKANNKYMTNYDSKKPSSFILYLDANNLYGWAMCQALPTGQYKWENDLSKFTTEFILNLKDDQDIGYILEVDVEYPISLHDLHNDYPFCAEQKHFEPSPYMKKVMDELKLSKPASVKKLTQNLNDKKNYVIHYRNLKQALENGLVLKKVHRVLSFKQSKWLAPYIEFNTKMRSVAKNDFEKDFFKLLNNSIFGKTCENLRKRMDIKLVTKPEKLQKLMNKPNFKTSKKISENLYSVDMAKTNLIYDRPIIVGFSVLELSKVLMYDFHYNVIKKKYGEKAKLLFTDTDSLCYHIETEDIYEDMKQMLDLFDFSDYPENHSLYSTLNKKIQGMFKNESAVSVDLSEHPLFSKGNLEKTRHNILFLITEFVGLRSKSYAYKSEVIYSALKDELKPFFVEEKYKTDEKKKAKGIVRHCVKKEIMFENYKNCVEQNQLTRATFNQIRSFNHSLMTVQSTKLALCPYDDKRYVNDDGITTLAHGHYKTRC